MPRPIKKAVFPVAGLGTRFLPATKAMPKEMLTVVDRPVIQLAVDEARDAGIEHFVFVTGRNKSVIEDHFDKQYELEDTLRARGKSEALAELEKDLPGAGQTSFTRQQEPKGLGHAVWCARDIVGDEPFALLLPDMVMHARPGCLKQMMDVYNQRGGNGIAVEEVPWEHVHRYGVVGAKDWKDNAFTIDGMVEKPPRDKAPSNLIISGRYILQPEIFGEIEKQKPGAGGEIQITDAMIRLMAAQDFWGVKYKGTTYDCGDKVGFLSANVALALERPDIGPDFRAALKKILS
ncbi:UTP--glucose-1-phosphate uridylyltransferase GalU [Aestuariivirga sp.]|uniref:UTP--glucose-1-phosphate uridylyltransferase GalU n=1 Tax=Aestuariivirga sp. TaxID=2650926 RepID=UPI0039E6564E